MNKGVQINRFKEEHNIKIRREQTTASESNDAKETEEQKTENRNVLVPS